MLEEIIKFLESNQWNADGEHSWTKTVQVFRGGVMFINGQQVNNTEPVEFNIKYIGEGEMWDVGEEKIPLCGFKLGGADIWVENLEDFKFWYQKVLGE